MEKPDVATLPVESLIPTVLGSLMTSAELAVRRVFLHIGGWGESKCLYCRGGVSRCNVLEQLQDDMVNFAERVKRYRDVEDLYH